ncbi:MAG TPA: hypothetical protein PLC15_00810 [Candidatus Obscuribacter sp.]|nr:hypothetical protein [Candidatus Obscuribacter sp.]HNB13883.1 hypothetical protein [Candidatus Obscuribacter sp.]HND67232.1 hypothetical protein [Candidatus Obscuribacter sp.]
MNLRVIGYIAFAAVLSVMFAVPVWIDFHPQHQAPGLFTFLALSAVMCWLMEKLEGGPESYPGFLYD